MSESKSYNVLKTKVTEPRDRIDRVENTMVEGMPDVNLCSEGVECWIEIKSPTEPKRDTTHLFGSNHKLSQKQKNWFLRHRTAGGIGYILIETDKRWILIDSSMADDINEKTVGQLLSDSAWSCTKPVRREEWKKLRAALNSKHNRTATS